MTKCLVTIMAEAKKEDADLNQTLVEIQTELYFAEVLIQQEQRKLIEKIFDPSVSAKMPVGVIKLKLNSDAPEVFFLN